MCGKTANTTTSSTTPTNTSTLAAYNDVVKRAQTQADQPYTPYNGELVAGMNQGQNNAIAQLQGAYGAANPYYNQASGQFANASAGLGNVQNYLQAGSQAGAQSLQSAAQAGGQLGRADQYNDAAWQQAGNAAGFRNQAAGLGSIDAQQQYMNPYTNSVINATMDLAHQNDAMAQSGLDSQAAAQGAYGGDRAGIAKSVLTGQQALANNQTIAGLNAANFNQATAARQADAGIYGNLANSANQSGSVLSGLAGNSVAGANAFNSIAGTQNQTGALYNSMGQTQGQTAAAQGTLGGLYANLGTTAQNSLIQGAQAGLQASTLQQQNQQAQDSAAYGQYQQGVSYPFSTTGWLSNIVQGIGSSSGNTTSTTTPAASLGSQLAGAATTGVGLVGQTGGFGANGWLSSLFADGGRVGHADGGGVMGGRPAFADGSIGDDGLPISPTFRMLNFSPDSLTAPADVFTGNKNSVAPVAPVPQPDPQGSGLGIVMQSPTATNNANPNAGVGGIAMPNPNDGHNMWAGITSAGLGMMAGTSPNALTNIGQGGLAGVDAYNKGKANDRQDANAISENTYRQAQTDISKSDIALRAKELENRLEQQKFSNNLQTSELGLRTKQNDIENRRADASLITQQPVPAGTFGPEAGFVTQDRRDPANPKVTFTPASQVSAGALRPGDAGSVSPANVASPVPGSPQQISPTSTNATVGSTPATVNPATANSESAPTNPTDPIDDGSAKSVITTDSRAPSNMAPLAIPSNYIPPNQSRIVGMFAANPEAAKAQSEIGKTRTAELQESAGNATNAQMKIAEMNNSVNALRNSSLAPGSFATQRVETAKVLNMLSEGLGGKPFVDPNAVSNAQQLMKDSLQLSNQMITSTNGAREAGRILELNLKNTAGIDNTYTGFKRIISSYDAANRYTQDKAQFVSDYYGKFGHVDGADAEFQKIRPWQEYAKEAELNAPVMLNIKKDPKTSTPIPPDPKTLKVGQMYVTPQGDGRWDGSQMVIDGNH